MNRVFLQKICAVCLTVIFILSIGLSFPKQIETLLTEGELEITDSLFFAGVEHFNDGRFFLALESFLALQISISDSSEHATAIEFMLMKTRFHLEKFDEAKASGRHFFSSYLDSRYLPDVYQCFGDIFLLEKRYRAAYESYLNARRYYLSISPAAIPSLDSKLLRLMEGFLEITDVEELLSLESDHTNRAILSITLCNSYLTEGMMNEAATCLFEIREEDIPELFWDGLRQAKKRTYQSQLISSKLGFVVSLSGTDEKKGKLFLKGVEDAMNEAARKRIHLTLEILDNNSELLPTVIQSKKFASDPTIFAIISPLSTLQATVAAAVCMGSDKPMIIPFSPQPGLTEVSENILQLTPDLILQGRLAADLAMKKLNAKSVAVLAPSDRLGKELTDGFVKRVENLGGKIVAIEWYAGVPENLERQFERIKEAATNQSEQKRNSNVTAQKSGRGEEIQLDVLYVPAQREDIVYISNQIPVYDLQAQLIGNSEWLNFDSIDQKVISSHLNNMFVVGDYFRNEKRVKDSAESVDESRWYDAGKSTMKFLFSGMDEENDRFTYINNLNRPELFDTGKMLYYFSEDFPRVNSAAHIFQFKKGQLKKVGEITADYLDIED